MTSTTLKVIGLLIAAALLVWTARRLLAAEFVYAGELIMFTSKTCAPCRAMKPIVRKLHAEGLPVREIDVDDRPGLVKLHRIRGVPTFLVLIRGREGQREDTRIVGATTETKLRAAIARIPKTSVAGDGPPP